MHIKVHVPWQKHVAQREHVCLCFSVAQPRGSLCLLSMQHGLWHALKKDEPAPARLFVQWSCELHGSQRQWSSLVWATSEVDYCQPLEYILIPPLTTPQATP